MESLFYVVSFVLPSVLVGVGVGFYLGRSTHASKERLIIQQERDATLTALTTLVKSAEQLTTDVDRHNTEIKEVGRDVGDLHLTGELENVQQTLLGQIANVLASNQRLEEDLTYTRYRMEEQSREIDRTKIEARTDALSGVENRKAFDERCQYLLTVYKRESLPFVLILSDVDHFKWINDTHGHQAGDRVVAHVGSFLRQLMRPGDHVARYGGDEFAILLPNTDFEKGSELVQRLHQALSRSNFDVGHSGERVSVTFSIGLTAVRKGDTCETIIARADQALYKSKKSGRNQVNCFREDEELVPC